MHRMHHLEYSEHRYCLVKYFQCNMPLTRMYLPSVTGLQDGIPVNGRFLCIRVIPPLLLVECDEKKD